MIIQIHELEDLVKAMKKMQETADGKVVYDLMAKTVLVIKEEKPIEDIIKLEDNQNE